MSFARPSPCCLGPLEELLGDPSVPPDVRTRLELAHRNSLRLLKLVNSLLDFSRLEAGKVRAFYEPVDLSAYTADLASTFRSAMERAGLEFDVDCPPLPQPVYVDREMWEKVVLNLLSNAFKFTLSGRVTLRLRSAGDGSALLQVEDTGVGVPAQEIPRLFERFHRVEGTQGRTHEGSGIGLALVQELVRLHGGNIEVCSQVNVGTTFSIRLPFGSAHLRAEHLQAGAWVGLDRDRYPGLRAGGAALGSGPGRAAGRGDGSRRSRAVGPSGALCLDPRGAHRAGRRQRRHACLPQGAPRAALPGGGGS